MRLSGSSPSAAAAFFLVLAAALARETAAESGWASNVALLLFNRWTTGAAGPAGEMLNKDVLLGLPSPAEEISPERKQLAALMSHSKGRRGSLSDSYGGFVADSRNSTDAHLSLHARDHSGKLRPHPSRTGIGPQQRQHSYGSNTQTRAGSVLYSVPVETGIATLVAPPLRYSERKVIPTGGSTNAHIVVGGRSNRDFHHSRRSSLQDYTQSEITPDSMTSKYFECAELLITNMTQALVSNGYDNCAVVIDRDSVILMHLNSLLWTSAEIAKASLTVAIDSARNFPSTALRISPTAFASSLMTSADKLQNSIGRIADFKALCTTIFWQHPMFSMLFMITLFMFTL
ncbi:uncharacterized protein V1518DRAFT_409975 [Limtongia smithiae]|uniref:uncharacterized protein n=1 Tax=Limtongia smithiae TaxID=1125753 RepID=UPI0034CFC0A1